VVGGEVVAAHVAHGRGRVDAAEDSLHGRPDAPRSRSCPSTLWGNESRRPGCAREVEEVGAFGVVESQRVGECVEDLIGGAGGVAAFQAFVVLDAHAREGGDLFASQAGHAPLTVARQASLLGGDLRSPGGQELRQLACWVH
jgi:hypothetical protein